MRTYVVEKEALLSNIRTIREKAAGTPIWAVLKGNGYGLGIVPFARILREQGIDRFCVTEVSEARALRESGFAEERILMLQPTVDRQTLEELLAVLARERREAGRLGGAQSGAVPPPLP